MERSGHVTSASFASAAGGQPSLPTSIPTAASNYNNSVVIARSASFDDLSDSTISNRPSQLHSIQRTLSVNNLASLRKPLEDVSRHSSGKRKPAAKDKALGRHFSARSNIKPRIKVSKYNIAEHYDDSAAYLPAADGTDHSLGLERKSRSVSGSLSDFARKSWSTASRSPSPRKLSLAESNPPRKLGLDHSRPSPTPADLSEQGGRKPSNGTAFDPTKTGFIESKKPRRPLSAFLGRALSEPKFPSVPPIPKSFSSDILPSMIHIQSASEITASIPRSISSDRLHSLVIDSPRRRDELWSAFKALDGEFQKFQSRPNVSKTGIVRSALLPFLRSYAEHPSNILLKPEDLDRRIQVLNRWWIGLLEMLNGRNGESVSGNDRPAILEAAAAIMVRPEWNTLLSQSTARSIMTLRPSLNSLSTTSLGSATSDFLVESIFHNIKNTFAQNLLAQMAYVVDKMSNRNIPPSVVAFCGKATAYAFFYCEGVAEILVRIWGISLEAIRRVLTENGLRRDVDLTTASERVITKFPPCSRTLSFRSLKAIVRYLRRQPQVPIATMNIPWHGSWVARWSGRETDLFFAFTKSYYNLACRLLPDDHNPEEVIAVPGYILIQAQILTILDTTMQHTISQPSFDHLKESTLITFDDILEETDASATLLPLPGIIRSMAENRLIMLLRDCLSGGYSVTEKARTIFAESFEILLKASARRISVFDHNGCFTFCDFMEEAIVILARYRQASDPLNSSLDWPFWFEVWRKLMESQNTMTEIRLYALLYSLWGTITLDESRKREICLEWLLEEQFFQDQFNHWCPMVRAYFMRLLCWRVARVEGKGSEVDRTILDTLSLQLERGWCHYLYLKESSAIRGLIGPSTVPCSPAPGRRLLIIRDDLQVSSSGMFLNFDSILSHSSSSQATAYERHSSLHSLTQGAHQIVPGAESVSRSNVGRRRWGLLKNIIPFTSLPADFHQVPPLASNPLAGSEPPWSTKSQDGGEPVGKTRMDRAGKNTLAIISRSSQLNSPPYRSHSFKFSLEWIEKDKNFADKDMQLQPPKLPVGAQFFLQTQRDVKRDFQPCKPVGTAIGSSKYAGRALAEWSVIIIECQNFFERRRSEGVPMSSKVETPTLGIESFRRFG